MAYVPKTVIVVPVVAVTAAKIKFANAAMLANAEPTVVAPSIRNAAMLANAEPTVVALANAQNKN
jgi:hypothetical protein